MCAYRDDHVVYESQVSCKWQPWWRGETPLLEPVSLIYIMRPHHVRVVANLGVQEVCRAAKPAAEAPRDQGQRSEGSKGGGGGTLPWEGATGCTRTIAARHVLQSSASITPIAFAAKNGACDTGRAKQAALDGGPLPHQHIGAAVPKRLPLSPFSLPSVPQASRPFKIRMV